MTEPATCEPPPEHDVICRCGTSQSAAEMAAVLLSAHLKRPHIWKGYGFWLVGWRYVGPARPPKDGP
jgi:hypothetical protein